MSIQNMKRSETTEQIRTNGGILKAAGLKSGVPDICLPVAMGGFHGLYIELKFGKNKTTKSQDDYIGLLKAQGYKTAVCYGAEEAREEILDYLTEPGRMPKKVCVTAPWIAGKCDGIGLPSKMFAREECRGSSTKGTSRTVKADNHKFILQKWITRKEHGRNARKRK